MKLFQLKTEVCTFSNCKEFSEFFKINEDDLIFTSKSTYDSFLKPLKLKAEIWFKNSYGTGEPSDIMIDKILKDLKGKSFKRIFAVGGGSVIDIAKLMIFKDTESTLDLFERKIPFIKDKQLIAVPTTCGAGSEVSSISIAELTQKNTKMGLASDELFPDYAVLIPELVKELPYKFFITSSVDAMIHAVESFVSPKSSSYTELFSLKALELILNGYLHILKNGEEARMDIIDDFLKASNYAGIAFSVTGTGAVHAMSYPLGGTYHITHGEANYLMFVEIFKTYNKKNPDGKIKEINQVLADIINCDMESVYDNLTFILDNLLPRKPLRKYGMKVQEIEAFTDSVIESQQRLLVNSYVPLTRDDMVNIYSKLF